MEIVIHLKLTPINEAALIHKLVRDVDEVESAVIMRPYKIGPAEWRDRGIGYLPDETTRQEL